MRVCLLTVRCAWLFFAIAAAIAVTGISSADQRGDKKSLDEAHRKAEGDRKQFMSGDKSVASDRKRADEVAKVTAEYFLFRITHRTFYDATPPSPTVESLHKEFAGFVDKKSNPAFKIIFGAALVESMKDVLGAQDRKKDAHIIVNAAMMLPTMAKLKTDAVGKYLVNLVNDPATHEAVRFNAIKGLREYMPITPQEEDQFALNLKDEKQNARRNRETEYVTALTKFIERPVDVKNMSIGQVNAVRYVRREAISALARAGSPAVLAVNKKSGVKVDKLQGPVAPTLLKVLSPKGGLQPPPNMREKIEAVHGLLTMKYTNVSEYNPEVATCLIGKTLVDFTQEYNVDLTKFTAAGPDKKAPFIAWKTEARSLQDDLKEFVKNNQTKAAAELKVHADANLSDMLRYNNAATWQQFKTAAETWRPANKKAFKTLPSPEIPLD